VPVVGVAVIVPLFTPGQAVGVDAAVPVGPAPASEIEVAKQQLDAASRQLAANLDDRWKVYLALPPEVYIPNHMPTIEELEQAIHRYEAVSQQPQYASLTSQPAFQATLKGLWRLGELQQGAQQKLPLPAPPAVR